MGIGLLRFATLLDCVVLGLLLIAFLDLAYSRDHSILPLILLAVCFLLFLSGLLSLVGFALNCGVPEGLDGTKTWAKVTLGLVFLVFMIVVLQLCLPFILDGPPAFSPKAIEQMVGLTGILGFLGLVADVVGIAVFVCYCFFLRSICLHFGEKKLASDPIWVLVGFAIWTILAVGGSAILYYSALYVVGSASGGESAEGVGTIIFTIVFAGVSTLLGLLIWFSSVMQRIRNLIQSRSHPS